MLRRRNTRSKEESTSKVTEGLRLAFKHEVRLDDYLLKVWVTSILAGLVFAYLAGTRSGAFNLANLMPMGGWQGHDPSGVLYMETWSTVLVDAMQAGFGLWGGILIFLGVYRAASSHQFVFGCFSLGIAFIGFVLVLPGWTQTLLGMIIERCPFLVQ